jgi:CRISPR system Cascade subunit CasE
MHLLPDHLGPQPRHAAGLLFRLEPHPRHPVLLIQTTSPPDLTRLPDGYGTADTRDLTPLLTALTPGRAVHYRITANPSVRNRPARHATATGQDPRPPGKISGLHHEAALAWWQRRASQAGITLHNATATPCAYRRRDHTSGPYHTLTRFEGTAYITDPAALAAAVCTGIGKGKPYGAGLLSLAPA